MSNFVRWLHKILQSAWNNLKISGQWMTTEIVYIPKKQNSTKIDQLRPMSMLNVEEKIFSVMASRLTNYLTEIGYVNISVRYGALPGVLGCLEHITP
ncbi:reverse transcriptase [Plakobranchus ocellatus]|uniref:Reverse transcriptase n=1 Tax=Plakobranchus ocellatus TaxID=259542 RepID=A0AAV4BFE1_9GAST|nr:reverse transcriptase [Plakobranchus ocellatus]